MYVVDENISKADKCHHGVIRVHADDRTWTVRDTPWSWPFVDIEFDSSDGDLIVHLRPFSGFWFPAPAAPWRHLSAQFRSKHNPAFTCASKFWSHVSLQHELSHVISVDCAQLQDVYPFVHRKYHSVNCAREELQLVGGRVLQSVYVKEDSQQQSMPFGNFTWA